MSILDENGNPPAPAQGDAVAQTKQLVLAEIEKLLELIRRLDHESKATKDTSCAVGAVLAMQSADHPPPHLCGGWPVRGSSAQRECHNFRHAIAPGYRPSLSVPFESQPS